MNYWGYELIIDANKADNRSIRSLENIKAFIDELIIVTDMKKMCDLHSCYIADTPDNRKKGIVGWSIVQLIETSSITIHLCEGKYNGDIYLNFFSCKSFNPDDVKKLLVQYFNCNITNSMMINRDANV